MPGVQMERLGQKDCETLRPPSYNKTHEPTKTVGNNRVREDVEKMEPSHMASWDIKWYGVL